jgi:hypothetical protein
MASSGADGDAGAELLRVNAELAKERAEADRLRADIASAAVSFASGTTTHASLLSESDQRSPPAGEGVPTPTEGEDSTIRSLELQIQVARDSLAESAAAEAALAAEIALLSGQDALRPGGSGGAAAPSVAGDDAQSMAQRAADVLRKAAVASSAAAAGHDAVSRDAGRVASLKWREHSLPNLALVADCAADVATGVVVDRVFDGIVAFTSGRDRMVNNTDALVSVPSASKDYELVSCAEELSDASDAPLLATVASQYSTLTIDDATGARSVRLVAVSAALDCFRQLLEPHTLPPLALSAQQDTDREAGAKEGEKRTRAGSVERQGLVPSADGAAPHLSDASKAMAKAMFAPLLCSAPNRFHASDLQRLYCTDTDGVSLSTLLKKVANRSPVFLLIRDANQNVFGCYGPAAWRDSCTSNAPLRAARGCGGARAPADQSFALVYDSCAGSRSYGSGESFVFRQAGEDLQVYRWTRANRFFQISSHDHLAIGGGGQFALWLGDDLCYGTTAVCPTFGNPPLTFARRAGPDDRSGLVDFEIVVVEAWVPVPRGHLR